MKTNKKDKYFDIPKKLSEFCIGTKDKCKT